MRHLVVDLYARWQEDAIALSPDVLSVMVGINDVGAGISGSGGVSAEYWLWNGVHPMPAGHELLARAWTDAVADAVATGR